MTRLVPTTIPIQHAKQPPAGWQAVMADAVTDPAELCRLVDLPASMARAAMPAVGEFGLRVPRPYLARIRPGDPNDPLLLQVLPQKTELASVPQFTTDPVAEQRIGCPEGLLGKYPSRVLMVATGACGVHCRFCFRRHFPHAEVANASGSKADGSPDCWGPALDRIASRKSIREVILSGGDPLTLDDSVLAELAQRLARIEHLCRLRIHTRLPIVIPDRVTDTLLAWLRGTRLTPIMAIHVNHTRELDGSVLAMLARIADAGVPVLSQTVLLRGVNDRVDVLAELFERLVDHRVLPYYVHQLDRVAGAAHFEVSQAEGLRLFAELRTRLPGYALPRYVREVPGEPSKRVLA